MLEDFYFQTHGSGPSNGGLQLNVPNPNKRTWYTVFWPRLPSGCSPDTVCTLHVLPLPVWVAECPFGNTQWVYALHLFTHSLFAKPLWDFN